MAACPMNQRQQQRVIATVTAEEPRAASGTRTTTPDT
jgi:hypothetical protein